MECKEVKMQSVQNEQPQKLSYEELNQACAEMSQQLQQQNRYIQQLQKQLQEMNFILQNKRIDCLFRVVELASKSEKYHFKDDFVCNCMGEIEEILTIPEQKEDVKEANKED